MRPSVIHPSTHRSVTLTHPIVRPSIPLSLSPSIQPATYLSIYISIHPSACRSVCLFAYLSVYLFTHVSSIYLTFSPSPYPYPSVYSCSLFRPSVRPSTSSPSIYLYIIYELINKSINVFKSIYPHMYLPIHTIISLSSYLTTDIKNLKLELYNCYTHNHLCYTIIHCYHISPI